MVLPAVAAFLASVFRWKKSLSPRPKVRARCRPLQPDRVAKKDRTKRDDTRDRVAEKAESKCSRFREPMITSSRQDRRRRNADESRVR